MPDSPQMDKFYVTEILNDLHKNGFSPSGKACEMLECWSAELRDKARAYHPASRLKREFARQVGKQNW